ncbi:DEAD/DEAH box helicase [Paraferrimonas sp. SM1919]|uniref:DEAD/DEAH box helicase n=1 Tax=Paraferrimonas sp. SM1919 TaxID=2662263 RepID=UPI001969BB17|nr:DEAD/DEAH box helicase [Paraferrimonas sp. SM1919]
MTFDQLIHQPQLLSNIQAQGFLHATEIQANAIPVILTGMDLMAGAQTGSGKTAAFALPIIEQLLKTQTQPIGLSCSALILAPTRELACQIQTAIEGFITNTELRLAIAIGGAPIEPQIEALKPGVDILVATPGRLLDLNRKGKVTLKNCQHLVLDEADRLLDLGFMEELQAIVKKLPKSRQTLLFSATFDPLLYRFAGRLLNKPKVLQVSVNQSNQDIEQKLFEVDPEKQQAACLSLLKRNDWSQVLVFARKKEQADKFAQKIIDAGISCQPLHGDLTQAKRDKVINEFREANLRVLVATDVAARGLDIPQLPCVINLNLPFRVEDFVHRVGRTGRNGNKGYAISFYSSEDARLLEDIEQLLDVRLPKQWLPGFEPDLMRADMAPKTASKAAIKKRARRKALKK